MKLLLLALLLVSCADDPNTGPGWTDDIPFVSDHIPQVCEYGIVCPAGDLCVRDQWGDPHCCIPCPQEEANMLAEDGTYCKKHVP